MRILTGLVVVGLLATTGCTRQMTRIEARVDQVADEQQAAKDAQRDAFASIEQMRSILDDRADVDRERAAEFSQRLDALCPLPVVEAHDGKLSLRANPEGGLTVTCWLPPAD